MRSDCLGILLLCLGACAPAGVDSPAVGANPDQGVPDGFTVSGSVVDLLGEPVADLFVTVSTEYCIPDRTDTAGAFEVVDVTSGPKRLITYGETVGDRAVASVVFSFVAESELALPRTVLAPTLASHDVDPDSLVAQTIESAEGLLLTIAPGSLTLAPFAQSVVQVVRVPISQAPPFAPDGIQLVDLFALHPIQSTLSPPASLSFPADTGLSPGTPILFHTLDYETGLLVAVASGVVDDDAVPRTVQGQGIGELTWVGLSIDSSESR